MRNPADSVLERGLRAHLEGVALSGALGEAVVSEVIQRAALAAVGGMRLASPWTHWAAEIGRTRHQADRDDAVTRCFKWIVVTGSPRSDVARAVRQYVALGVDPIEAVRQAVRVAHDQRLLASWCARGHELYRPDHVWPYLAPHLRTTARTPGPREQLSSLTRWVHDRLRWMSDRARWRVVDEWQAPAVTLALGTGDCEDFALVLWSAMPLLALPEGQLVVGTWRKRGHAWIEVPELGLHADPTAGTVTWGRPATYEPRLFITPGECHSAG